MRLTKPSLSEANFSFLFNFPSQSTELWRIFSYHSKLALGMAMWVCWSFSGLSEISQQLVLTWSRYPWCPEDESYRLWWCRDFAYSTSSSPNFSLTQWNVASSSRTIRGSQTVLRTLVISWLLLERHQGSHFWCIANFNSSLRKSLVWTGPSLRWF